MVTAIPATTGPTSARAADRRREIVAACQRVIVARGFEHTRMADIAAEIGVTAPLLLHYFGSKNELLTAALVSSDEPYLDDLRERFEAGVSPERLLVSYVEDSIWPTAKGRGWWRQASAMWMNAWITALNDPSIAAARADEDRRWRAMVAGIVVAGQRSGAFRAEVDAAAFVPTLFALLDGFLVQLVLEDAQVTKAFAHEACFRFVSRELGFDPGPHLSSRHRRRRRA